MDRNIAQEMLRALPDESAWAQHQMNDGVGRCLIGARLLVGGVQDINDDDDVSFLIDDEYTKLLARIISEQFPGRGCGMADPIHRICEFNDGEETRFADVWMVMDKARTIWDEKEEVTTAGPVGEQEDLVLAG